MRELEHTCPKDQAWEDAVVNGCVWGHLVPGALSVWAGTEFFKVRGQLAGRGQTHATILGSPREPYLVEGSESLESFLLSPKWPLQKDKVLQS